MPEKLIKWGLKFDAWPMLHQNSFTILMYIPKKHSIFRWTVVISHGCQFRIQNLTKRLENKGNVLVMDDFFMSVELFQDLDQQGIYALGTIQSNCIGLHPSLTPKVLFNPKWVLGFGMLDEVANFVLSFSKFSWL